MAGTGAAGLGKDLRAGFGNAFGAGGATLAAGLVATGFALPAGLDRPAVLRFADALAAVFALACAFVGFDVCLVFVRALARALVFFVRLTLDLRAAAEVCAFLDADFALVFLRFALAIVALPVMDSGWGVKRGGTLPTPVRDYFRLY